MDPLSIENWFQNKELSKGQATQIRIVQSATQLFSQRGFGSVTLQMIAENSNSSHPLILKHFGSKEDLLFHVRQYVKKSSQVWVDSKINSKMTGREALHTYCLETLRWVFEKPSEGKMIILTYYYNSLSENPDNISLNARKIGTQRILKFVLQAKREGSLSTKEKPQLVAEMVQEALIGLGVAILTSGKLGAGKLPLSYKKKVHLILGAFLKS